MTEIFREYHRTHHWINFKIDVRRITELMWLKLGQVQAKCDQISGVPLLPSVADQFHRLSLAKGVLGTTAIEGNTLTEEQVLSLLKGELELPRSKQYLAKEIENILQAVNTIANRIFSGKEGRLQPEEIKEYNKMVLDGLTYGEEVIPGQYRNHNVGVLGYRGAPPEDVSLLVAQMCDWLNSWDTPEDLKISMSVVKAIVAHVYVAWIHPFADGNGRTARLIELQVLLSSGFPTPAAHLLSNYYNETREKYYHFLRVASKKEDGIYDFIEYAIQGFLENLNEQIKIIEAQQLKVHWESYVHEQFRNKDSKASLRQRRLILDLWNNKDGLTINEIRELSPRIAIAYAGKTDKTIQRDLKHLESIGLVFYVSKFVFVNRSIVSAFLPKKRTIELPTAVKT